MVDQYQTGEPIPDGHVHLQLINPFSPHIDYRDYNQMPANLEGEFNLRKEFKHLKGWKFRTVDRGVEFHNEDGTIEGYPWHNIHNWTVVPNSEEYAAALKRFQLNHDHEMIPQPPLGIGPEQENYSYCYGCKVTDKKLLEYEQERIDEERNLRRQV